MVTHGKVWWELCPAPVEAQFFQLCPPLLHPALPIPPPLFFPFHSLSSSFFFFSAITQESLFCMYYKEGSSKNQQSPEPQGLQQCLSSRTSSCYTSPSFWQFLLKKIFLMHIFREKSTMNLLYTHHLDSTIIKLLFPLSSTSLRSCFNFETEELLHQLY